ncbi:hypothetical protein JQC72_13150 [Polycladomyces sp. WAk]|uniref:Uncharacterized protein n=1 Tax=Polycladomyces zharkentensis TaxID=2807616 RepID=A0ABS2WLK6_9BACL|nr:hypothetical protein [Polycladomyces sp. WAk]MBN2910447.1 hypothetical protein [Polycladomyces sp. WAk]
MGRKKKKQTEVRTVDPIVTLTHDLKRVVLWMAIAVGAAAVLALTVPSF